VLHAGKGRESLSWDDGAGNWRALAEQWRIIADDVHEGAYRQWACRIAEGYDRMARHAEERADIGQQ
jgi:hypothetical protein